jgi:hypothetical protein
MTAKVQHRNDPTIFLGVGVQVEFKDDGEVLELNNTNISLPFDFQTSLLSKVSKRQTRPSIGVRGDLSEAICFNSRINHCVSMGCPSLTISRDLKLGRTLQDNGLKVVDKLRSNNKLKIAIASSPDADEETKRASFGFVTRMAEQYGDAVTLINKQLNSIKRMEKFLDGDWKEMNPGSKQNNSEIKYVEYMSIKLRRG